VEEYEPYVSLSARPSLRSARAGHLPAHPIKDGKRRQWRFKISELDAYMKGDGKKT
jgi:hypothetical protein